MKKLCMHVEACWKYCKSTFELDCITMTSVKRNLNLVNFWGKTLASIVVYVFLLHLINANLLRLHFHTYGCSRDHGSLGFLAQISPKYWYYFSLNSLAVLVRQSQVHKCLQSGFKPFQQVSVKLYLTDCLTDCPMPLAKHILTMDRATDLISSLFDFALSCDMPFLQS